LNNGASAQALAPLSFSAAAGLLRLGGSDSVSISLFV